MSHTADQEYQYLKAAWNDDVTTAKYILSLHGTQLEANKIIAIGKHKGDKVGLTMCGTYMDGQRWMDEASEPIRHKVLERKFATPEMVTLLRATGVAPLIFEDSNNCWGWKDGKGQNRMGTIIMEIRAKLPPA